MTDLGSELVDTVARVAEKYGIKRVWVIDSVDLGGFDEGSDVSFLVELPRGKTLIDLISFEEDLMSLLGIRVKVVTIGALRPEDRESVLKGGVLIVG